MQNIFLDPTNILASYPGPTHFLIAGSGWGLGTRLYDTAWLVTIRPPRVYVSAGARTVAPHRWCTGGLGRPRRRAYQGDLPYAGYINPTQYLSARRLSVLPAARCSITISRRENSVVHYKLQGEQCMDGRGGAGVRYIHGRRSESWSRI